MNQLVTLLLILCLMGCKNKNNQKMNTVEEKENIGTIVVVMVKTKPEYTKSEIVKKSKAIDPMLNKFKGYLGRKMVFADNQPDLLADFVYYTDISAFEKASEIELKSDICNTFFATMIPKSESMYIATPKIMTVPKKGVVNTVELVLFKTKPEFTEAQIVKAAKAINPILEQLDGFISRKLAVTEQGEWLDILYWTDSKSLEIAVQKVMTDKTCQTYFNMGDDSNTQIINFNVAIDTEN